VETIVTTDPAFWLLIADMWEPTVQKAEGEDDSLLSFIWDVCKGNSKSKAALFVEEKKVVGFAIISNEGWKCVIELMGMRPKTPMAKRREMEAELWKLCESFDEVVFHSKRSPKAWLRRLNAEEESRSYRWLGNV